MIVRHRFVGGIIGDFSRPDMEPTSEIPEPVIIVPFPVAERLVFPVEPYEVTDPRFGEDVRGVGGLSGIHLGDDIRADAGTVVRSIADGMVVYAALHPGTTEKGNWGNIMIIGHRHPDTGEDFFSLYGHLGTCLKTIGDVVACEEPIGPVGEARTPENGWWEAHLHFALYRGPWGGDALPGYLRVDSGRTRLEYWTDPSAFIRSFRRSERSV